MKIEKLSENQIRCTLNKSDLASRQLKISELAYGSEKAKELFRDMMQQASYELGFEADDIPIMIEAIPVSADCIVLIVTKVDDPEELDTRFSKFTPSTSDYEETDDTSYDDYNSLQTIKNSRDNSNIPTAKDELTPVADPAEEDSILKESLDLSSDVMNLFSKVKDYLNNSIAEANNEADRTNDSEQNSISDLQNSTEQKSSTDSNDKHVNKERTPSNAVDSVPVDDLADPDHSPFVPLKDTIKETIQDTKKKHTGNSKVVKKDQANKVPKKEEKVIRIFSFPSYDYFSEAAKVVSPIYCDRNSLYKDAVHAKYYLSLEKSVCTAVNFNKTCNILSEYGKKEQLNCSSVNYFGEHLEVIIKNKAIQVASKL